MNALIYRFIWLFNILKPAWILIGFIFIGILLYKKPKAMFISLLIYCCIISLNFEPSQYDDLYRYHEFINRYRELGWGGVIKLYDNNYWFSTSFLYQLLLYGLSLISNNYIATTLITLTTYFLIGCLNFRISRDYNISKGLQSVILISQFIAIDLYSTISSWLYMLTLSILAHVIYTDLVRKKHRVVCLALYIVLGSLHTISYTILLFRILAIIPYKKVIKVITLFLIFWRSLVNPIMNVLMKFGDSMYMQRILRNMEVYGTIKDNSSVSYMLALAILVAVVFYLSVKIESDDEKNCSYSVLNRMIRYIVALVIGAFGSANLMFRYSHFIIMFVPLYWGIYKKGKMLSIRRVSKAEFMYILALMGLALHYVWISYRLLI